MGPQENSFADQELSGWWRRVGAYLLDGLVLLGTYVLVFGLLGAILLQDASDGAILFFILFVFAGSIAILILYWGVSMSRGGERNGQSPGKQMLGIAVIREDGQEVTFGWALWRQVVVIGLLFGTVFSFFTGGIILFIDYLWPLWDEKRQCLHDKMVASRVALR